MSLSVSEESASPSTPDPSTGERGGGCSLLRVDIHILPGTSVRRKVYSPDTTLERVKRDLESELYHRPLRVVALDTKNSFDLKPHAASLHSATERRQAGDDSFPDLLVEEKALEKLAAGEEETERWRRLAWETRLKDLNFEPDAPAQLFAFAEAHFVPAARADSQAAFAEIRKS